MKRKILKYGMFNKRIVRSKDVIALMETLNNECNFLAAQPVNIENNFKPYVMLQTTKEDKLIGIVVTLEYRGICDYCRASIELEETLVGAPKVTTNESGEQVVRLMEETYNLAYSGKQYVMEKTGYKKDQIVPFTTYIAYTFDGILMNQIGTCGYRVLDNNNVYVDGVQVSEDYRRCGIASTLLDVMGKDIQSHGFTHVQLDSLTTKSACELYRSRNYELDLETYTHNDGYLLLPLIKKIEDKEYNPRLKCPMHAFTAKNNDVMMY